jgi:hypothetical protein
MCVHLEPKPNRRVHSKQRWAEHLRPSSELTPPFVKGALSLNGGSAPFG